MNKKDHGQFKKIERNVLASWIKFSRRHRKSNRLPVFFGILIFFDGFVMVIPGTLCMIACITISPRRWWLFGLLFPAAAFANNAVTYFLGRIVPHEFFLKIVDTFGIEAFWQSAVNAIRDYGPWATFLGAIFSLPTQMITALIGLADSQAVMVEGARPSIGLALILVFFGHLVKTSIISYMTYIGRMKIESALVKRHKLPPDPEI